MPEYRYQAVGNTGTINKGQLTANSEQEVMSMLDSRGLFPIEIAETKPKQMVALFGRRVSALVMATFYSQLADLLHSGVPLLKSLEILERQSPNSNLQYILREVKAEVADGTSLADAMNKHPGAFNELSVSMIRAGQEGGFLEEVLKRIASFTEHQEDLKSKVVGALVYPFFLAFMGIAVLLILVIFFIPMFEPIFERLRETNEMPTLTVILINTSHFMKNYFWLYIPAMILMLVLYWRWAKSESGRLTLDTFKLKIPTAGKIYLNLALSRFCRILGTLLQNGIPILQSLKISKDSTGNVVITDAIDKASENVTGGNALAEPLQACKYFPRDIVEMIAVGEESNNLEMVLLDIANNLERRTNRQLEMFVRLLEPIMLMVMAVFTLIIVAGLLLPVFKMSQTVKG